MAARRTNRLAPFAEIKRVATALRLQFVKRHGKSSRSFPMRLRVQYADGWLLVHPTYAQIAELRHCNPPFVLWATRMDVPHHLDLPHQDITDLVNRYNQGDNS